MFSTGLGNYEFDFEGLSMNPQIGEIFTLFAVIINSIVLLNFIIAILADTYGKYSQQSLGLYYDGIIARIPVYEDDARYGGLIVISPPFSIFAIFLLPFFCCIEDENRLRYINDLFTKVSYAPVALILTVLFVISNLIMMPFAYLAAIY